MYPAGLNGNGSNNRSGSPTMYDVRGAVGPAEELDCEVAARKVRCLPAPTSPQKEDQGAVRGYAGRLGAEGHLLGRVPALP